MGFGFNLAIIFIILPLSVLLLVLWLFFDKTIFAKILVAMWLAIFVIVFVIGFLTDLFILPKKKLDKEDYYGTYIIDRDFFKGKQADWQYNHFRFEIRENDSIYFYIRRKNKLIKFTKAQSVQSMFIILNVLL